MPQTEPDADRLMKLAADGDAGAWGALLTGHEDRLRRMVAFRLDRRLSGRIDASDIVQGKIEGDVALQPR